MSYKQKYLKYKEKYLQLKNKIGGYKPDVNTVNEMKKYVDDGTFDVEDFVAEHSQYTILQNFFNNIKDCKRMYLTPDNFDDFMGKIQYTKDDLDKFWIRLNKKISSQGTFF